MPETLECGIKLINASSHPWALNYYVLWPITLRYEQNIWH